MAIPISYRSALLAGLIENMESHFLNVSVPLLWDDYGGSPDIGESSGAILIDRLSVDQGATLGPKRIDYTISFLIRSAFALGSASLGDAYDLVDYAYNYLIGPIREQGITGTWRGRSISKALTGLEPFGRPLTLPNEKQDLLIGYSSSFQITWSTNENFN
jgi:hypothetical protein